MTPTHTNGGVEWSSLPLSILQKLRPSATLHLQRRSITAEKFAVPARDPRYENVEDLAQIEPHVRRELEHFFEIHKELQGRTMQMRCWGGREEAKKIVEESRHRYLETAAPNAAVSSPAKHG